MYFVVSLFTFLLLGVDAFVVSPTWIVSSPVRRSKAKQCVKIAAVLARHESDESTYHYILNKAREYAFSDSTTVNEAKQYLTYILELESACISGTAVGRDICDNVLEVTDIVAHLRQKADQKQTAAASSTGDLAVAFLGSFIALTVFWASVVETKPGVVPFTPEEWIWAAQGGYFDTMISHFIRNGGL